MKRMLSLAASLAATAVLAACAAPVPHALLTYETAPAGATLYEGGQSIGVAPVTRTYPAAVPGSAIRTPEVTAVWPSGAKATFWTNLKVGDDNITTITRPAGAPGLDVDEANARTLKDADARAKADLQRSVHRNSARCLAQQQGGVLAGIDDCQ
jgi:hypothetical protein